MFPGVKEICTPLKSNILNPKNGDVEEDFPFQIVIFRFLPFVFLRTKYYNEFSLCI